MPNEYAQVTIRTTKEEHKKIKAMAKKADTTMNQFIVDTIFKEVDTESDTKDTNEHTKNDTSDTELIEVLKDQLEVSKQELNKKNEYLDKKDEQIENLHNIINQEQQLSLKSSQQIEYLQLEIETTEKNEKNKRGFWSRLFNTQ